MNQLRTILSQYWLNIQASLFRWLNEELGELTEKGQQLVMTLELVRAGEFIRTTDNHIVIPQSIGNMICLAAHVAESLMKSSPSKGMRGRKRWANGYRRSFADGR